MRRRVWWATLRRHRPQWMAIRVMVGNYPALIAECWTEWGARRAVHRDQRQLRTSPAYRWYEWTVSRHA